ncbi:hypothetical protein Psuf_080740 [Phytohabitans suffuscus]|uniref:ATP-dependent DNA ligase family profile domain-containing protein n=1 Tax=Phytohabitans suffuscus TaxID=624315 RepID=A0A6F8YY43_9ACTN|nr:hypothetical protein [Phytohabitans suffuscus]BCB90761.1 hypothetical protein Psuf_080740 [Phytohabitans suffuscus]
MGVGSLPLLRPMLATLGELPGGGGWSYEFKWDGVRAVVYVEAGEVRVLTRNDRDVTGSYPELRALPELLPRGPVVLDGEIVTLDGAGAPSFARLQQRMHVREPAPALLRRVPIHLYAFDVLHLGSARRSSGRTASAASCSTASNCATTRCAHPRPGPTTAAPT